MSKEGLCIFGLLRYHFNRPGLINNFKSSDLLFCRCIQTLPKKAGLSSAKISGSPNLTQWHWPVRSKGV